MLLNERLIHPDLSSLDGTILRRQAVRGVVRRGDAILLLYTERYNDYSLPGGGVDAGEHPETALVRELEEETGACDVRVLAHQGVIEEFRPHWKPEYDLMHMTSQFFQCTVGPELRTPKMEHYEEANGMRPLWINLHEALAHNEAVMARQEQTMGLSIQRETLVLRWLTTSVAAAA